MGYQNVLIIDDSGTSRMIIKRCFEIAGLQEANYHEVEDGLKALSFLEEHSVDLIITDLKMPKMDGSTLIQKLRTRPEIKDIPIIVISSMGSDVVEQDLLAIGAQAIVPKPISPEKISATLEELG